MTLHSADGRNPANHQALRDSSAGERIRTSVLRYSAPTSRRSRPERRRWTRTTVRWLTFAVLVAVFTVNPWPADSHLVRQPVKASVGKLEGREISQQRNVYHSRYVCRYGGGKHQEWACNAVGWLERELAETRAVLRAREQRRLAAVSPRAAIRHVFGPTHGADAISVARCETGGTFSVHARNGQYLGLFQMGDYARSTYGHSWTALGQARAAHRYFLDAGWSPWQCLPGGGLRW